MVKQKRNKPKLPASSTKTTLGSNKLHHNSSKLSGLLHTLTDQVALNQVITE